MKRRALATQGKKAPSSWPIYSLVSTVAVACYLNGLNGDFVHDDIPAVTLNKDVLAINPISHAFKNDFWGTPMADLASHKSYRPLTILTFRANFLCFSLQPVWFHVTNVVLHAAACILFTRVCLKIAAFKPPFATLAGLLFAAHPIHTEAVTGIVGRADVLACVFFLVSLLAYHGHPDGKCHIWISVSLGGLSMLAKETGVSVFLLNLAYDFYRHWPAVKKTIVEVRWNQETQQFANRAAKVLTSLGILLAIRLALLQGSLPKFSQQDNPTAFHPSLYVRVLTFCYLAAFNWWLLLCPATLSHDWQMGSIPLVTSLSDSRNLMTCFFFGMAALLLIRSLCDFENQKHTPVVLGLMLLIFPFLPAANLVVTVGFVVAERVLYIPSLGCTLLVVYGIQILWTSYSKHRQTIICCVMLLLTTNCLRTVVRNRDWRSRESLLRAGLMTLPHNAKMHYNYANFLRDSARPELAKSHYHRALKLWPTYASAHNNLGTLLSNEQEAEQHFLAAIRYSADHVNAHYNLGQLYRKLNRTAESEHMLKRCINLEPRFTPAYIELARLRGPNDRSVNNLLKKVALLNPRDPYYSTIYGHWLLGKSDNLKALHFYWKALSVCTSYQEAMLGASKILRKFGQSSRIFQLITRWQSILRIRRGEPPISPHVYLHGWQLKSELSHKARAYDNCSTLLLGSRCVQSSSKIKKIAPSEEIGNKWTRQTSNKTKYHTMKQCKVQQKLHKQKPSTPLMVQHFLD
ncbi:protein O-mannosyl-transferase TMTC1-like [Tribolium madens]|uniref:protein O-mannosyl-transferase TMTC1-like n=1 Tax=Tribolium madens TaxID=41895 RepID=UPI001CF74E0F|nr:protein O-mannosyl-transferase TMTC1-like [Tribolium madens]XP_044259422.1 protein O-mannosyl-transferase TMTC1-like [Tribolium madens]XP_044259423.1 protein O-mannosyl-transferase TMTC1-like [Tribolium madens]